MTQQQPPAARERVAVIEKAHAKTTEGEWSIAEAGRDANIILKNNHGSPTDLIRCTTLGPFREAHAQALANAEFIALAHETLPALVADLRTLEAKNERLRAFVARVIEKSEAMDQLWQRGENSSGFAASWLRALGTEATALTSAGDEAETGEL